MGKDTERLRLTELIAIGIGGMIGGGIFSVLGIAVAISGHAAPLSFAIAGLIALSAGYSYIRLALAFRGDGASYTYLERAFPNTPVVSRLTGWTVTVGYIGTLALYAYTFGAYGADLLGSAGASVVRGVLSVGVLLFFMIINLLGVRSSGVTEDIIVYTKVVLLGLFGLVGLFTVKSSNLTPIFNHGVPAVFIGGATIFVAFEGFQLITNAVSETEKPDRNIPLGIYGSIAITTFIYLVIAVVGVGNLTPEEIGRAREYALAVAAEPVMGNAGRVLVALAALLATSSAINATFFGASRMMAEMAAEATMPRWFALRSRINVPWLAVLVLTAATVVFTAVGTLESIAVFSSLTFLLVSIAVSVANFRLRTVTGSRAWIVVAGIGLMLTTVVLLIIQLWSETRQTLATVGILYLAVVVAEFLFSRRHLVRRKKRRTSK